MAERVAGWYWVRRYGLWIAAEWDDGHWYIWGNPPMEDDDIEGEIGPRIERPSDDKHD